MPPRHWILWTAAFLLTLPYQSVSFQQEAWLGTWSLRLADVGERSEPARYKRVITRIAPWEDGLKVTYDTVGTRGGVIHMEWTGRFDGKDYAMQGVDYVMTNAYRKIDDRSYEIVIKLDGVMSAKALVAVSPNGRTLRVTTTEQSTKGQPKTTTATYERL